MTLVGRYVCDRYRILRKIGDGGMGEVFAAEDVESGRLIALKVLRHDLPDPRSRERFLREAEALAKLRSRNVVRIFDFDRDMALKLLFVAMELAHGDDLSRLLHHGRLPVGLALSVMTEVATGLGDAHRAGLVHRDLKPANLKMRVKSNGALRVKILDFGLVRDKNSTVDLTDEGFAPGTLTYMAPEILREEEIDHRIDIYSLGCIAYEMLTGFPPFSGNTPLVVARNHLDELASPIGGHIADLPDGVAELVHSMLEKQPTARLQTANDVRVRAVEIIEHHRLEFEASHRGQARDPFRDWGLLPHL